MKKLLFLLALVCCYGCSDSTTEMNEGNARQLFYTIKGTYVGNIMVDNIPQKVNLTVGDNFEMKYLPMRPILQRIFKDAALDEAEKSAGSVVFTAPLDKMAVTGSNAYLLLEPTDLVLTVKVNGKKAVELLTKAIDLGDGEALFVRGVCSEKGIGVEKDPEDAQSWYAKAAEKGVTESALMA